MPDHGACARCGKLASTKCGRCLSTFYCNFNCQRSYYKKHKSTCEDPNLEEYIYRAGTVLQELFLVWAEKTWNARLDRVEQQDNILKLYTDTTSPALKGESIFRKFPDHLLTAKHDKKMALSLNKCVDALAYLKSLLDGMLRGTNFRVNELGVHLKTSGHYAQFVSPLHPKNMTYQHLVAVVRGPVSSNTWVLDPTGFQNGNTAAVLSYGEFTAHFVDKVYDYGECSWGSYKGEHCLKSMESGPQGHLWRLQWITADAAKKALYAWTKTSGVTLQRLLREPDASFNDHLQAMLRAVESELHASFWEPWDDETYGWGNATNVHADVYKAAVEAMSETK